MDDQNLSIVDVLRESVMARLNGRKEISLLTANKTTTIQLRRGRSWFCVTQKRDSKMQRQTEFYFFYDRGSVEIVSQVEIPTIAGHVWVKYPVSRVWLAGEVVMGTRDLPLHHKWMPTVRLLVSALNSVHLTEVKDAP